MKKTRPCQPRDRHNILLFWFFAAMCIRTLSIKMADRDQLALQHFRARAQQPKVLMGGPAVAQGCVPNTPTNVYIVYDQPFGSTLDQIDDLRFRYRGTSNAVCTDNRRVLHSCIGSMFTY
jgi:hypothetical protein